MTAKSQENGRVSQLLNMLKARTNHDGTAKPGYKQNVATLRAELAQLQVNPENNGG